MRDTIAVLPPQEEPGRVEYPTPYAVHTRQGLVQIPIPYTDASVFEGDDISPVLQDIADDLAKQELPPLRMPPRPYRIIIEVVDKDRMSLLDLDDVNTRIKQVVESHCRLLRREDAMLEHTTIPTFTAS